MLYPYDVVLPNCYTMFRDCNTTSNVSNALPQHDMSMYDTGHAMCGHDHGMLTHAPDVLNNCHVRIDNGNTHMRAVASPTHNYLTVYHIIQTVLSN